MSPYETVYGGEPRQQDWQEIKNGKYIKVLHEQIKPGMDYEGKRTSEETRKGGYSLLKTQNFWPKMVQYTGEKTDGQARCTANR